jgi:transposase
MSTKPTEEFKRDAVRMALTSGLARKQLAGDLGVGLSTLNKWVNAYSDADTVPQKEAELVKEIDRLRRELCIVTEERETLKKATAFFAAQKR